MILIRYFFVLLMLLTLMDDSQASDTKPTRIPANVGLDRASGTIKTAPMNVSIVVFDPFGPDGQEVGRMLEPIRSTESIYFPVLLKETLIESGYWGAVSVVPDDDVSAELLIKARIIKSDALVQTLLVEVKDSRGMGWLNKTYTDHANDYQHDPASIAAKDPFQDLYNQIANDMAQVKHSFTEREVSHILDTATLRYAIALSPQAFNRFLLKGDASLLELTGLPARSDAIYQRVLQIRELEYQVRDLLDEHFKLFFMDMQSIYPFWRRASYELLAYNSSLIQLDGKGARHLKDSWTAIEKVYKTYRELKMNEDELRELAGSFKAEIKPSMTELEGQVIELEGSLKIQYATWHRLLQELYQAERSGLAN